MYLQYYNEENRQNSFFHRLDVKLRQTEEVGDPEESGAFKMVGREDGKWIVHESMCGLLSLNQRHAWRDIEYPITENCKEFQFPNNVLLVLGYRENGRYVSFRDQNAIPGNLYMTASDTIAKSDGEFQAGETIDIRIVEYPPRIINDSDIVKFPTGFYDLLALDVISLGSGYAGKQQAAALQQAYITRLRAWQQSPGQVRKVNRVPRRSKRFGGTGR